MSQLSTAVLAAAEGGEHSIVGPLLIGGVALAILVGLLIVTMLINVDR